MVWTEHGPILNVKLYNNKPAFCWGHYNILLNIFNLDNCLTISNNAAIIKFNRLYYAIHPNIHSDIYKDKKYGSLVCLGDIETPIKTCIKKGELYEACEILITMLNGCQRESLSYYWAGVKYSYCNRCSDLIELGKRSCEICQRYI